MEVVECGIIHSFYLTMKFLLCILANLRFFFNKPITKYSFLLCAGQIISNKYLDTI